VPEPADVLELQVIRLVQVDMGLRGAVDQQCPTPWPVGIPHQLGQAVINLGPQRGPGDPGRAVAHRLILPLRCATGFLRHRT